jgi:uncharacterized membrane protein required for colicin V production
VNWLDFLFIFVFVLHTLSGFSQGFLKKMVGVLGFVAAFYLALRWGADFIPFCEKLIPIGKLINLLLPAQSTNMEWLFTLLYNILGFILLFIVFHFCFKLLTVRFRAVNKVPVIGFVNILGGGLLGAAKGMLLIFIISSIVSLMPTPFWVQARDNSAIIALSEYYLPLIVNYIQGKIFQHLYVV